MTMTNRKPLVSYELVQKINAVKRAPPNPKLDALADQIVAAADIRMDRNIKPLALRIAELARCIAELEARLAMVEDRDE